MSLNWKNIMKTIGAFSSPRQAVSFLFDKIAGKDAQLAASLKRMYTSGEDATKVLEDLTSQEKITLTQFKKVRECYSIARKLGMKQQIPEALWQKAEKIVKDHTKPPAGGSGTSTGFNGF